ncbi:MAG: hypothetical protein HZB26_12500 [Candidatus Hydrogenedentes bacterium]|nr:hypothetical protein [Candidatus Hydrogenedentota bacterium]
MEKNSLAKHPKSVRRRLLTILYEHYNRDPLEMLTPEDLLEDGSVQRGDLLCNAFYLHDRGLVELMIGYNPPMFAAARITYKGIDLVENPFEFNLQFPPAPDEAEQAMAEVPFLLERLVQEADFSALDGELRRCLLRDVQYLRDELLRPVERWRKPVAKTVIGWIEGYFDVPREALPSLFELKNFVGD